MGVFFVVLILVGLASRGQTLEKQYPRTSERELFDTRDGRLYWGSKFSSSESIHPRSRLIISDQRMIVCQKMLLGGYAILLVVEKTLAAADGSLGLVEQFEATDVRVKSKEIDGKWYVVIRLPSSAMSGDMRFLCSRSDEVVSAYKMMRDGDSHSAGD